MRVLRVLHVPLVAIAATALFSSCTRVSPGPKQDEDRQPVAEQAPIDPPPPAPLVLSEPASTPAESDDLRSADSPTTEHGIVESGVVEGGEPLASVADAPVAAAPAARRGSPVGETRKPVEERKSSSAARARGEINFDDLKFELEKDAPFDEALLTDQIRQLEGTTVKLRGYILPSTLFSETNISQFVLVRDNQECCFGPGAALFDCVMVEMVPGKTTDFVTRPVTVEGKFVIDTDSYRYPPGLSPTGATHMAVFRIEGHSVR